MKIFGIGLSKTGTKSLNEALCRLGYDVRHYPEDELTAYDVIYGRHYSILERCDGITDTHAVVRYKELDQRYPGSKFIFTVRERVSWLKSMATHYESFRLDDEPEPIQAMAVRLRAMAYGSMDYDRRELSRTCDRHARDVHDHFFRRPDSLLVMNIIACDGWNKLCSFLGRSIPTEPFPRIA